LEEDNENLQDGWFSARGGTGGGSLWASSDIAEIIFALVQMPLLILPMFCLG
jgi:hypothetical protein